MKPRREPDRELPVDSRQQLRAENGVGKRDLANFLVIQIANLYGRHIFLLFASAAIDRIDLVGVQIYKTSSS